MHLLSEDQVRGEDTGHGEGTAFQEGKVVGDNDKGVKGLTRKYGVIEVFLDKLQEL